MPPKLPLRDVAVIKSGGTPSKSEPAYWSGDLPWVSPKDMVGAVLTDTQDHISPLGVERSATSVAPTNAILIVARSGVLAHTVPTAMTCRPMAFNQDIKAIIVDETKADPSFVFWFLRSQEATLLGRGVKRGATVHSLRSGFLESLLVPLLPLAEQRCIVDILNHANSIRRLGREAQEKARQVIPALFAEMFGDPIQNPNGWPTRSLGELVDAERGISYGIVQRGEDVAGGTPVARISNIANNEFDAKDCVRTAPEISDQYKRTLLRGGELLLSIRGSVGRVALAPESAAVTCPR